MAIRVCPTKSGAVSIRSTRPDKCRPFTHRTTQVYPILVHRNRPVGMFIVLCQFNIIILINIPFIIYPQKEHRPLSRKHHDCARKCQWPPLHCVRSCHVVFKRQWFNMDYHRNLFHPEFHIIPQVNSNIVHI